MQRGSDPTKRSLPRCIAEERLAAGLTRVGMSTLGFCISFRHISAGLGGPVVLGPVTVVDLGGGIHPDHARSAAGSRSFRCTGCSRGLGFGSRRSGRRCGRRRGRRRTRVRRSGSGWRGSRCRSRSAGCVPGLYASVASARTTLACTGPVGAVITKPGRAGGSACRYLSHTCLRNDHCGYS